MTSEVVAAVAKDGENRIGRLEIRLIKGERSAGRTLRPGNVIYVGLTGTQVAVIGSVNKPPIFGLRPGEGVGDALSMAGDPTKGADKGKTFVIHANGAVSSGRQFSGWFGSKSVGDLQAQPGATVFLPEQMDRTTFIQASKDSTQILCQFGLRAAESNWIRQ